MDKHKNMKGIFVTGTDTGVGKTLVCGCLARYLEVKGFKVITQKWIQTGCQSNFSADIKLHLKLMGKTKDDIKDYLELVNPYIFRFVSSPHLASQIEKKRINADKIIKSFKLLSAQFDFVIVEGIGGALVPFKKDGLVIDIVKQLDLAVLVVAQNKLGAINHTLLTLEALRQRGLKIVGIVFNNLNKEDKRVLEDNPGIIKALTQERILGVLPWIDNYNQLYQKFIPIGNKLYDEYLD